MFHFLLPESVSCEWTLIPPISRSDTDSKSRHKPKLQALVYEITPPTTAITDDATGLKKTSANGYFFKLTDIFSII